MPGTQGRRDGFRYQASRECLGFCPPEEVGGPLRLSSGQVCRKPARREKRGKQPAGRRRSQGPTSGPSAIWTIFFTFKTELDRQRQIPGRCDKPWYLPGTPPASSQGLARLQRRGRRDHEARYSAMEVSTLRRIHRRCNEAVDIATESIDSATNPQTLRWIYRLRDRASDVAANLSTLRRS